MDDIKNFLQPKETIYEPIRKHKRRGKNELRRRRQKAEQIAADRRAELCKKSEKFARLEQKYNELSKALVKAAISGNAAERTALSGELSHTAKEEEKNP